MEENKTIEQEPEQPQTPFFKMVMDDYMLLLFAGVAIYSIFYLIWGIMELACLPQIPAELKQQLLK